MNFIPKVVMNPSSAEIRSENFINPPFGLQEPLYGNQRIVYDDNAETRPFFVPPGFMRIGLEEHRARCCPPGLYDLEPHEMFQAVLMKFCAPNQATIGDAVIDLPMGDFTQSVVIRQPSCEIWELHLVVKARITAMKKFAMTNSSNPGAIVYMILRNEVVQRLQSLERPAISTALSSSQMMTALNEKTSSIGLSIHSVFVDTVVKDSRFSPNSHGSGKRFSAPNNRFQKAGWGGLRSEPVIDRVHMETMSRPPSIIPEVVHDQHLTDESKQSDPGENLRNPAPSESEAYRDFLESHMDKLLPRAHGFAENDPIIETSEPPLVLGHDPINHSASDSDDINGTFASNRFRPQRRESNLLARMATATKSSLFPGKEPATDQASDRHSSPSSSSTWSLCDAEIKDDECMSEGSCNEDGTGHLQKSQSAI